MKTLKNRRFLVPQNSETKKNFKVFVIGDFHGKFPIKLKKIAKRKDIDLVVSVGDYCPFSLRKEFFKYIYRKHDREIWEFIGKKKVKEKTLQDLKQGEKILKEINKSKVPVFTITGNLDYAKWPDLYDRKTKIKWGWAEQDFFGRVIKKYKNIKVFDYSYIKFNGFVFIGVARSTFPGKVKSKNYRKYKSKLDNLFRKFKKEKIILVSHNVPYGKLDGIKTKEIDKKLKRKHYGSKLARRLIDKYQPILTLAGHMHENPGKAKLGKTIVINPGAAVDGKAAIVEIDEIKGKVKNVRFIKS